MKRKVESYLREHTGGPQRLQWEMGATPSLLLIFPACLSACVTNAAMEGLQQCSTKNRAKMAAGHMANNHLKSGRGGNRRPCVLNRTRLTRAARGSSGRIQRRPVPTEQLPGTLRVYSHQYNNMLASVAELVLAVRVVVPRRLTTTATRAVCMTAMVGTASPAAVTTADRGSDAWRVAGG